MTRNFPRNSDAKISILSHSSDMNKAPLIRVQEPLLRVRCPRGWIPSTD